MQNNSKQLCDDYKRYKSNINDVENKLENLKKTKDQISEEKFNALATEYTENLEKIRPKLRELEGKIKSEIEKFEVELKAITNNMSPLEDELEQETKLYKAGAISKEQYANNIAPLKEKLKGLRSNCKVEKEKIKSFKNALSNTTTPLNVFDKVKQVIANIPRKNKSPNGDFNEDFKTGCLTLILIVLLISVGIPLLWLAIKTGTFLAIPVIVVICFIVVIAFFGRIVNFIKQKW